MLGDYFVLSHGAAARGARPPGREAADGEAADRQPANQEAADGEAADGQSADWQPAGEAYRDGLADLAAQLRQRLATRENRVAIATLHLGYAARLWSPVLACALAHGIVPDLRDLELGAGLPLRLRLPAAAGWLAPPAGPQLAGLLYRAVVTEHLAQLAAGLRGQIADGLLRGNAASAMIGALAVLAAARPGLVVPARSIAERLLDTGTLRGTGRLTGPGLEFRRGSCCLYYRVPGGGLCGDCSLRGGGS